MLFLRYLQPNAMLFRLDLISYVTESSSTLIVNYTASVNYYFSSLQVPCFSSMYQVEYLVCSDVLSSWKIFKDYSYYDSVKAWLGFSATAYVCLAVQSC